MTLEIAKLGVTQNLLITIPACMSLQPRTSFWNRIMSVVNGITSQLPSVRRPSSPALEELPRKRRRGAGKGYVMPENRNQEVFEKCDWVIDGPYRRVPPYYYVLYLLSVADIRRIILGLSFVGMRFLFSKSFAVNSAIDSLNTIELQLLVDQSM